MDQRGTGLTQPRMDCPEQEVVQIRSLSFGLNRKAAREALVQAAADCRARVEKEGTIRFRTPAGTARPTCTT
jgi:hypothetical protein